MKKLVFLSAYPHDDPYKQRLHHMLPALKAQFSDVTLVTGIMPLAERVKGILKNPLRFFRPAVKTENGIRYLTVYPLFPNRIAFKLPFLFKVNGWIIRSQIKHLVAKGSVVGTCQPFMYSHVINSLDGCVSFYDCPDIYEDFPWSDKDVTVPLEVSLINKVDYCFGSSHFICKTKMKQSGKLFTPVLNAVDYDFHEKRTVGFKDQNRENGIVYLGALAEWFDYELMNKVAKKYHDKNIYLIGSPTPLAKPDLDKLLAENKNVKFLGQKDYGEVPSLLSTMRVGIIPFMKSQLIEGVSPLKLFEYAANGLQIVSMSWDELQPYEDKVYLANNHNEFIDMIGNALEVDGFSDMKNLAKENTWNSRVKQLVDFMGL